ncbi:AAA family ATPase [uncultured Desulfobacter sp.]|uniref:AAA family ATPase n=1 Tax=uncultured Desulfobacter sp. TaxID=240139 RepID=UPI0029F4D21E|nr:AAA family ATPase [uncultured Desulfobacter sp.]
MKLRKALERAKSQRQESIGSEAGEETDSRTTQKNGWSPPVYSRSRPCRINSEVAERYRSVCLNPSAAEIEQYKILRTHIKNRSASKPIKTVMVTSAWSEEGKTVTCINLGLVFSRSMNQTVLLVDCDLKGQDIHRYLGVESQNSLIDYFLDDMPLDDLIVWPGVDKLTLISGSRTIMDSSELLSSPLMAKLVKEMSERYDDRYVFFDAPPVLERSEAISLAPLMDGVIMVVEAGKTSKKDIIKAANLLPKENFLGFVLNKQK